jgi:hypothetical protein
MSISLTGEGYAKLVLHAVKYPTNDVNGLLIGKAGASTEVSFGPFELLQ